MFPGGTGTSSRVSKGEGEKVYTTGVLVQSNYGMVQDLHVGGIPMGKLIVKEKGSPVHMPVLKDGKVPEPIGGKADDGSIVIILM